MNLFDRFFGPPTEDKFAKILADALSRAGDDRQSTYDKSTCRLLFARDGKKAGMMNLRNLFSEYCNTAKHERAAWLSRLSVGLLNQMDLPDDFEDVKPDLLPALRPRSVLDTMRLDAELLGPKRLDLPALPLSEHLVVCVVYDLPSTMRFVTQEDLTKWGVSLYEAAEVAKHNLEERQANYACLGGKLFTFVEGDAFDATRMLLLDRIRSLEVTGDPIAMPLTRETLLITGSDDEAGLCMMAVMAEGQKNDPRPICPIPHRLVGDEWQPWCPPADDPNHETFRLLALRYWYGEYGEQKRLLDKRNEQTGNDIFVASFSAVERDKVLSYCAWSKGVLTWLPMTQFVGLYDPEIEAYRFVAWEQLVQTVGPMMKPLDCYPPRWLVDDFPSEAQIEQMKPENWSE